MMGYYKRYKFVKKTQYTFITNLQVRAIRREYKKGVRGVDRAAFYKITPYYFNGIGKGRFRKDVK